MRVEAHSGLRKPVNTEATRVVVYDIYDNPIAVIVELEPGHQLISTPRDKSFNELLVTLGIRKTVVATPFVPPPDLKVD